jgi:hypothetical protein
MLAVGPQQALVEACSAALGLELRAQLAELAIAKQRTT